MAYSTIRKKKCKCGCNRYPSIGYAGFSSVCAPQDIKDKVGSKTKLAAKNRNARLKIRSLNSDIQLKVEITAAELNRWFEERRNEMTGRCANCGGDTKKYDDKYYRYSIAHLLPKTYVKSVRTHPDNWLELCYFGNGCHPQFDEHKLDLIDMSCFSQVIDKIVKIYPFIAPDEKRRIPAILLEYIKTEQ